MRTIHKFCLCLQLLPLLLGGSTSLAQSLAARRLAQPQRPPWITSDASLEVTGTVTVKSVRLSKVLELLTSQTKVALSASPHLKDCRVSIFSEARPLSEIMMRIQDLFHHGGPLSDHTCYWLRIEEKGAPVNYLLTQSHKGLDEEEENAGVPAQKLAKWLRDMRTYVGIAPEKRRKFQTDFPFLKYYAQKGEGLNDEYTDPLGDVVGALTDAEIEQLAFSGRVDTPNYTLPPSQLDALVKIAKQTEHYRNQSDQPPAQAYLQFHPDGQPGRYSLDLGFATGSVSGVPGSFNFDTLDNGQEYDWTREMLDAMDREEHDKPVDLITAKERVDGKIPILSVADALERWCKATGRRVFGEIFLKPKAALQITSGKPETLLTRVCAQYGYDWRKAGDTYLVYSKSWGADRASDIPDDLLDKWSAVIKKEGYLPLETALEMSSLSDRQFKTLQDYLYVTIFAQPQNIYTLRLLSSLSRSERELAMKPNAWRPLNTNDPHVVATLASLFSRIADFHNAVLQVEPTTVHGSPAYSINIGLPSGESKYGFFSLQPPQAPMTIEQPSLPDRY